MQDFVPLAESLEWQLGQQYLRQRGNKAFLSDTSPVPFVINNDGTLSRNAAEVFFASLLAADKDGQLEDDIFVLELGIGVGLFARYFLDHLRDLCRTNRKNYYERIRYIAADRSHRVLQDMLRHGVMAEHPGRYCVRQVDALSPETLERDPRRFRGGVLPCCCTMAPLDSGPKSILKNGPDSSYREPNGTTADGFSTSPAGGPFDLAARKITHGERLRTSPMNAAPPYSPSSCRTILRHRWSATWGELLPGKAFNAGTEIRFGPGCGLEQLLAAWPN